MKNGYKIDFASKTISVTKAFMKQAETYDTEAYKKLLTLKKELPDMRIVAPKTNRKGKKRDNLTYANMITFIKCQNNAEILLKEFEKVKELASGQGGNAYQNVKRWFLATFPNYKDIPSFDEAGNLISDFGRRTETRVLPMEQTSKQEERISA